jgi:ribosome biogenesis GTPase
MEPQTYQQGVVIRRTTGNYEVLCDNQRISCVILPLLSAGNTSNHKKRSAYEHPQSEQTSSPATVGDIVRFSLLENGSGVIREVLPRQNRFSRRAASSHETGHASEQVLVANVDQIVPVLAAANPTPSWNMLDRYLVMAEAEGMSAIICINKVDLLEPVDGEFEQVVKDYRQIGYPVVLVSAQTGQGLAELQAVLQGRFSVLLGKSGVGKTSLLNALQPGLGQRVNEVSDKWKHRGKHTTTHLEMFMLDFGGTIVDTPGERELGLWDIDEGELDRYFPEMRPLLGQCKFGLDCRHDEEPGCVVRKAVMAGQISPRRYKSYMRMREGL